MKSKESVRKEMIKFRKSLPVSEVIIKSDEICDKIINSQIYNNSSCVYCYFGVNNEVSLQKLILHGLSNGKKIALPKVKGKDIFFHYIKSLEELEKGYFNIPEPAKSDLADDGDLIIVPGVAFSKEGGRLGYGGGFYDRFLADKAIYSIGVGYDFQVVDDLPTQKHDITLNQIIYN